MKQTVEEVAKGFAKSVIDSFGTNGVPSSISAIKGMIALGFENGAEWHAKQSPWISVEDKAGCDTSDDCIVMVLNGDIFRAYFSSENKWMKRNCGYYDEVIDDVVWWMPIPSFDEILEANKDVLQRLKDR